MNADVPALLGIGVQLRIAALRERGGPSAGDRAWALGWQGDLDLLSESFIARDGHTARVFNDLARVLSILAFRPHGVTFLGLVFEEVFRGA